MKKYLIDTIQKGDYTAGSKARMDIDDILLGCDFEKINIIVGNNKKKVIKEISTISKQLDKIFDDIENGSLIAVQYPWDTLSYSIAKKCKNKAKQKNIKMIAIIHDLNSIRTGSKIVKIYYKYFVKEIKYLNVFDGIVCHNQKMREYLVNRGIDDDKIVTIEMFDYLMDKKVSNAEKIDFKVINIAGNLSRTKAEYVYKLSEIKISNYDINLYGPFYDNTCHGNVHYYGTFPAEKLAKNITKGFGLVWDGEDINTCSGHFGNYMLYNNPHKLSLYLACGIPVIVWKKSAISEFVQRNHIGFLVSSLKEINDIFENMTVDQYKEYLKNVSVIQKNVLSGFYIKRAIKEIENRLGLQ